MPLDRIVCVIGTRPEAIKLAPVITALRRATSRYQTLVCISGQHREMLQPVLDAFRIEVDVDLAVMREKQSLAALTARALEALDQYFAQEEPKLVLVQGDTTTALCAGLAAFYRRVTVGHVEAGLRTGNMESPWPEEANRVLLSRIAALHFAPTEANRANLIREGLHPSTIHVTGNTVVDSLEQIVAELRSGKHPGFTELLQRLEMNPDNELVLVTGHRRENIGEGLEGVCQAIRDLADRFPKVHFVYPVHLNPNVRAIVQRMLGAGAARRNIHLLEPVPYLHFVGLMSRAKVILTDSGGIQEEAPSLGVPVLITRNTTERPEGVAAGCARMVGTSAADISDAVVDLLTNPASHSKMSGVANPYGDGKAGARIAKLAISYLRAHQAVARRADLT